MDKLEKDNIVQVIFGIAFSKNVLSVPEIERIHDSYYKDYESKDNFNVSINDRLNASIDISKTQTGITLSNGRRAIILDENRVVLIQNPPYLGAERMFKDFMEIISNLKVVSKTIENTPYDFGIRYINKFTLNQQRFNSQDFDRFKLPTIDFQDSRYSIQRIIRNTDISHILNILVENKPIDIAEITLDIDTHTQFTKIDELVGNFERIRDAKNTLFSKIFPNSKEMKEFRNE